MDVQTSSNKIDAFRSNFFIKLGNNKKLLILSLILSMLGLPLIIAARIIDFREEALRRAMTDVMYSYVPYTAEYYYLIGVAAICILLATVLVAAFNTYQYMYNKPMVDVIFSLPITVNQRFFSDYLSGIAAFAIPFIVSAIPAFIINAMGFSLCSQWKEYQGDTSSAMLIFKAYAVTLLVMLMLYTTAVLVLSICGSLFESILYTAVFNVIVPVVIAAVFSMSEMCIYGLSTSEQMANTLMYTTFVGGVVYVGTAFVSAMEDSLSLTDFQLPVLKWAFVYLIIILVLFAASYFLYKNRKAEDVSKPFAFKWIYYTFMTAVCFCMMCGMFITVNNEGNFSVSVPWLIMTMIIFLILDTIQHRGFKKFLIGIPKFIAITGGSCLIIFMYVLTGGFGAAYYVPPVNSVKSVEIVRGGSILQRNFRDATAVLDGKDDIESIIGIHENVLGRYKEFKSIKDTVGYYEKFGRNMNNVLRITYTLKSGRKVSRIYSTVSAAECRSIRRFENNDANINNIIEIIKLDVINSIDTRSDYEYRRTFISNKIRNSNYNEKKVDYSKLIECYEKDLRSMDTDYITATPKTLGYFDGYAIFDTFTETLSYLKTVGIEFTNQELMASITADTSYYSGEKVAICLDASYFADEDGYITSDNSYLANYEHNENVEVKSYTTNRSTGQSLINILMKAEPVYSTNDKNAILFSYEGTTYLVPAECSSDIYNIMNYAKVFEDNYSYGGYGYTDKGIAYIE